MRLYRLALVILVLGLAGLGTMFGSLALRPVPTRVLLAQSASTTTCPPKPNPFSVLGNYKQDNRLPTIGAAAGQYTGEFSSAEQANTPVDPSQLPQRPYLGTELYWEGSDAQEQAWFQELQLDFLRVQVTPAELLGKDVTGSLLPADFSQWSAADFEVGGSQNWHFNDPDAGVNNILSNRYDVPIHLMMMMHYGGESYMGAIPTSQDYADYFLATVYYYNVIRGLNIQYWEVLNEPDYGYGAKGKAVDPQVYADIFQRVVLRIRAFPDPRVNSITLGGPVLGSGDPIDGEWPDGYANRDHDDNRFWREYMPTLLQTVNCNVGFLSWHDYGDDSWGWPNSIINMDRTYAVANRVNAFSALGQTYTSTQLPLVVSEMNLAAGKTDAPTKAKYKNFYAALWHTSALNNYFSTGKVTLLSHFYWKGHNDWPKGLVYKDTDSDDQLVRNPVWWAYREYMRHTQTRILASYSGTTDPWADAIVTTDDGGQMLYLIANNRSNAPRTIDFTFSIPSSLYGPVVISRQVMVAGGQGRYGQPFAEPAMAKPYSFQPVEFAADRQVHYRETIPADTIVYYTIMRGTPDPNATPEPTSLLPTAMPVTGTAVPNTTEESTSTGRSQ